MERPRGGHGAAQRRPWVRRPADKMTLLGHRTWEIVRTRDYGGREGSFCRPAAGPMAASRPLHGRSVAAPWPLSGRSMAAQWPPLGRSMAAQWPLHGRLCPKPLPEPHPYLQVCVNWSMEAGRGQNVTFDP